MPEVVLGAEGMTGNKTKSLLLWSLCFKCGRFRQQTGNLPGLLEEQPGDRCGFSGLNQRECGRNEVGEAGPALIPRGRSGGTDKLQSPAPSPGPLAPRQSLVPGITAPLLCTSHHLFHHQVK